MISNKDFFSDIAELEQICEDCKDINIKALLKLNLLQAKLLHNMRTNQVLSLRAGEIPLVASKKGTNNG